MHNAKAADPSWVLLQVGKFFSVSLCQPATAALHLTLSFIAFGWLKMSELSLELAEQTPQGGPNGHNFSASSQKF